MGRSKYEEEGSDREKGSIRLEGKATETKWLFRWEMTKAQTQKIVVGRNESRDIWKGNWQTWNLLSVGTEEEVKER